MNAALQIAQLNYDRVLPPEDNEAADVARSNWLFESAEMLIRGSDVIFQRRMRSPQSVSYAEFATAVQDHLNQQQIDGNDDEDSFAHLVIDALAGAPCRTPALNLLGESTHTHGKLYEIADALLEPYADDALIAKAEDDAL
ncbi:MAG TPA: hypothetical protein VF682_19210 [Pseudomonas sp.]|jgi:hypothetical protein